MPVQLWEHVTDPLDVDKPKVKKYLKMNDNNYAPIPETSNE